MTHTELFNELIKSTLAGSAFEIYNSVPIERQEKAIMEISSIAISIVHSTFTGLSEDLNVPEDDG